eukprot:2609604-Amphidinium_carterae.1
MSLGEMYYRLEKVAGSPGLCSGSFAHAQFLGRWSKSGCRPSERGVRHQCCTSADTKKHVSTEG